MPAWERQAGEIGILDADDNALDLADANSHDLIQVVVSMPADEIIPIGSYFGGTDDGCRGPDAQRVTEDASNEDAKKSSRFAQNS